MKFYIKLIPQYVFNSNQKHVFDRVPGLGPPPLEKAENTPTFGGHNFSTAENEEKWFVKFGCPMKFYIKLTPYEAPLPAHLADFCSIGLKVPDLGPP